MQLATDEDKKEIQISLRTDEAKTIIELLESHPSNKVHHFNAMLTNQIICKITKAIN